MFKIGWPKFDKFFYELKTPQRSEKRARRQLQSKHEYYFLHIGKTGGTYASTLIRRLARRADLDMQFGGHRLRAINVLKSNPEAKLIFGIRRPAEIYVSGFYSRQRKGAPTHHSEWTPAEARAFARFATANELAESLSSHDADLKAAAFDAMSSIQHVNKCLNFYLGSADFLESHKENISFILDQEHLDSDLKQFYGSFGLKLPKAARHMNTKRHANPNEVDRTLSPSALANLEKYYASDVEVYAKCREIRDRIVADLPASEAAASERRR